MNLQWLGVPEGDMGLLGDPRAYGAAQGLAGLSSTFGLLGAAFAPTTDPSARGRIMAGIGPASQQAMAGVRQGAMQDYAGMRARQGADREAAMNDAMSGRPDDQLSESGRQYRGLLAQLPERVRAALPLLGPEQRGQVLAAALRPGERQNVVVSPGGALVDSMTGQPIYTAPQAPQRAPLPGPYDHLRFAPDGSLVDLRQFGGGGAAPAPQAPGVPAMPPNRPTLTSPNVGLPAPGRPSALTPNQPPPDASPAGAAPMLTPQPGDAMPVQGVPPQAMPPAPTPLPGTVRPPPPPEWQTVTDENRPMYRLPPPRDGAVWQRNSRTGETRQVGGSGVTVTQNADLRAETAEAAKRGTMLGEEEATVRTEAAGAANTIDALRQVRAISAPTGRLAPAREVMGGWLEAMGMSNQSRLVREASSIQAFNSAASSAVLSTQLQQKGVATEGDARRIGETWAQVRNTPDANDFIMRAAEAQATRLMERDEFYQNWRQQPGPDGKPRGTVDGAGAAWRRNIRETPLVTRLENGQVIFFNEFMANAQANSTPREEAMRLWRERAR